MKGRAANTSLLIGLLVFAASILAAGVAISEDEETEGFVNKGGYIVLGGVTAFNNFQDIRHLQ